jgi:hypothetical protein
MVGPGVAAQGPLDSVFSDHTDVPAKTHKTERPAGRGVPPSLAFTPASMARVNQRPQTRATPCFSTESSSYDSDLSNPALAARPAGTLRFPGAPRPGLLPPMKRKAQNHSGLSLSLDEKRGSPQ